MKRQLTIAAASVAILLGAAPGVAQMMDDLGEDKGFRHMGARMFDRIDADGDGAITNEEMRARMEQRFGQADSDGNLVVTKAEIIAAIERHAEHRRIKRHSGTIADRLVYRLDINDDGAIGRAEYENRAAKVFALLDFDDDGKVEKAELRRSVPMRHHRASGFQRIRNWWYGERAEQGAQDE